jgi:deazaflavin-dependent oxidoreductase (nitroreductase family)
MMAKYDAPPYQPKWILQAQVFLLRHFKGPLTKNTMIITTAGRKTGNKHSVPINFVPDGSSYLVLNLGGHSHWYLNALANPCVSVEISGKKIEARAARVPTNMPQEIRLMVEAFERERPGMLKSFFGISDHVPTDEELLEIGKRVAFMRFNPVSRAENDHDESR